MLVLDDGVGSKKWDRASSDSSKLYGVSGVVGSLAYLFSAFEISCAINLLVSSTVYGLVSCLDFEKILNEGIFEKIDFSLCDSALSSDKFT